MIDAKSLRIGNKIRMAGSTSSALINTVFDLSDNTRRGKIEFQSEEHKLMYSHIITVEENGNQYKPFEIEGIPLSEDILIKAGFAKHDWNEFANIGLPYFVKDALCLFFNESEPFNTYLLGSGFLGSGFYFIKEHLCSTTKWISTVHELQNAYYVHMQKELTINL